MTALAGQLRGLALEFSRIDRVALVFVGGFALLALLVPGQSAESLGFVGRALFGIAPFLALSVAVAAGARASGADKLVAAVFADAGPRTIILAAAFGALSPFCSCGVVPLVAALLAAGVPLAPVMAFWISSPIIDPEMLILTGAVLGWPFALFKLAAAIAMGVGAGFVTQGALQLAAFREPLRPGVRPCGACASLPESEAVAWRFWRAPERRQIFAQEARQAAWFLGKWLSVAFLVESLMVAYLPAESLAQWLAADNWWTIPGAAIIGVPLYLNGFAAIPTISGFMELGLPVGGAMAFSVAGGVTCVPAAMAVWALVKPRVFGLYVAVGLAGALAAGYGAALILG